MWPAGGAERGTWRGAGSSGAGRRRGQRRPEHRRKTWSPFAGPGHSVDGCSSGLTCSAPALAGGSPCPCGRAVVPASAAAMGVDGLTDDVRQRYHSGWDTHGVVVSTPRDVGTCSGEVGAGTLLAAQRVRAMTTRMPVPGASCRCGPPGDGVGLRGTAVSPAGPRWGHNGSGTCFRARAFRAPACPRGTVTVCVLCAIEDDAAAEGMVGEARALLAVLGKTGSAQHGAAPTCLPPLFLRRSGFRQQVQRGVREKSKEVMSATTGDRVTVRRGIRQAHGLPDGRDGCPREVPRTWPTGGASRA